jgi:hypothetical protein
LKGALSTADLPSITLLHDGTNYFSLNNRRLFVFKALRAAGKLDTVRVRVKPVPQTKRMKDKYTVEKCSLTAKLIREGGASAIPNEDDLEDIENELMNELEDDENDNKKVSKKQSGKKSDKEAQKKP